MKKEEIFRIIRRPYNREILRLIKKGYNIRDIQKEIGFSYKSAFRRIKDMEKRGLVDIKKVGKSNEIIVNPEYLQLVDSELSKYRKLKRKFKEENKSELTKKFLKMIQDSRFSDIEAIWEKSKDSKERDYFLSIKELLKDLGFIKERLEITMKGINYLK